MKKSSNVDFWIIFLVPIILIFLFLMPYFIGAYYEQPRTINMGNEIIAKIKEFRNSKHRLPASLLEIGIKGDDLSIFTYKKIDSRDFEIMYELSLGDLSIFHSKTDTWEYK